ncbi:MAG: phosphate ABC transporter permease subunit PstC [Planctomycetaceae bacterium]|nr:phosphate ABC transporter permease subunit PstC [Planctomycetaceae bacterium]
MVSQPPANLPDDSKSGDSAGVPSLRRVLSRRRLFDGCIEALLQLCAWLTVATTVSIIAVLLLETVIPLPGHPAFFQEVSPLRFFTEWEWAPTASGDDKRYGILPLAAGTLMVTVIAAMIGLPVGLLSAIYLSEYASPLTRSILKPALELLAGIPTVVFGYCGLVFLTPLVLQPLFRNLFGIDVSRFNALSGGIMVGIMIIPLVSSLSEDVLRAVPRSLREAGYALGSTRFDVSARIVVPAALSGVLASFLIALSRAIGETMIVAMCVGNRAVATLNPLSEMQTMTAFIVNLMSGEVSAGSLEERSLYAVALMLFLSTLAMNLASQMVLQRYREVYH